jgi:DNA processing protein
MENTLPWLALKSVPGIGNLLFKRLVERFNTPEFVFKATSRDL